MHQFDPCHLSGCVQLLVGQIVCLLAQDTSGWSDIEVGGCRGWVPTSFLMDLSVWNSKRMEKKLPTSTLHDSFVQLTKKEQERRASVPKALPPLVLPQTSADALAPMIRSAKSLYSAFCAVDTKLDTPGRCHDFLGCARFLLRDTRSTGRPQSIPVQESLHTLQELLSSSIHELFVRAQSHECALAVESLNSSLQIAAKIYLDSHSQVNDPEVGSDETLSTQTSSLLEEESQLDTCSSLRDSLSSSGNSQGELIAANPLDFNYVRRDSIESLFNPTLLYATYGLLDLSTAQMLACAHALHDQISSMLTAFLGQLHTFENISISSALQRLMDVGLDMFLSAQGLRTIVDCVAEQIDTLHVAPSLAREHRHNQVLLTSSMTAFRSNATYHSEDKSAGVVISGSKQKALMISNASVLLRSVNKVMRTLNELLEYAPSVIFHVQSPKSLLRVYADVKRNDQPEERTVSSPHLATPSPSKDDVSSYGDDTLTVPQADLTTALANFLYTNQDEAPRETTHALEKMSPRYKCQHDSIWDTWEDVLPPAADADATSNPPMRSSQDLVWNQEGHVVGGTLPCLLQWLNASNRGGQDKSLNAFFLCFRTFTEPKELCKELIQLFTTSVEHQDWATALHVVHSIFSWLKYYWLAPQDFMVLPSLQALVEQPHAPAIQSSIDALAVLLRCRHSLGDGVQYPVLGTDLSAHGRGLRMILQTPSNERQQLGLSGNDGAHVPLTDTSSMYSIPLPPKLRGSGPETTPVVSKSLLSSLRNASSPLLVNVLDFDATELARQITIVESQLYCSILPNELLFRTTPYTADESADASPLSDAQHIKAMSTFTTQLTNWIGECILRETDISRRTQLLRFFVRFGSACLALQNYNLLMAVQGALNSSTILRLKKTWAGLSSKTLALFEEQRKVLEHTRNFATYRAQLRQTNGPALPFVGLVLTDLTFCMDGNPKIRSFGAEETPVINFVRCFKLASIINDMQRFQRPFPLVQVPEIQQFIHDLRAELDEASSDNYAAAAEQLYQRSLCLEPRESLTHKPRQRSGSIVSLPWSSSRRSSSDNVSISGNAVKTADAKQNLFDTILKRL
ncbi:Ras guanine nucleotide exchange factor bud5 [Malassezia vespertilionis]|nr:Ras guanine nucleotide exchange factor bud5 [Malassezia vespertilionis]WFD08580.1 Ras guanine nucleotide exchange factor bud5 [Malassezia vespertilionis]